MQRYAFVPKICLLIAMHCTTHCAASDGALVPADRSTDVVLEILSDANRDATVLHTVDESTIVASVFERGPGYWTTPADEHETKWYKRLTPAQSQREHWYKVSPYVAEFWCTLSNVGFITVGIQQQCPELIFAGLASIISHSIPKNALLWADKLGVLVAASVALRKYDTFIKHPITFLPVGMAGIINQADTYSSRRVASSLPHVLWHFYAAYVAWLFLEISD